MAAPSTWSFTTVPPDTTPPAVTAQTPAAGATNIGTNTTVMATFSESIQSATLSFVLVDGIGNPVAANVVYNDTTHTATLTPSAALNTATTYTATVSGAKDLSGNAMSSPVSWSFSTVTVIGPISIWSNSIVPAVTADSDSGAVELGVKFRSDIAGYITGIRFYKGSTNTGTHIGNLWTSTGTLLGSATFVGESATGWQQVSFTNPIAINANTTYIASYYDPAGHYADNGAYFASTGADNAPLHALANGVDGGNGVYVYGSSSAFPNQTFNSTNYWVDVVFSSTSSDTTPPTVTAQSPAPGATGVALSSTVTATFSEAIQSNTLSFVLKDSGGNAVPGAVTYSAATLTATFTPSAALKGSTTYTATVSGAKDNAGNTMAPFSWSFTAAANASFVQTTNTDFATGTTSGTVITNNSGGEVQLAASFSDDFNGSSLSAANWTSTSWASAGGGPASVTVSGGIATIFGQEILSTTTTVGRPVEGRITIAAVANQQFGLATNLTAAAGNYWAVFTTRNTTNSLNAEVNVNGTVTDVKISNLLSGYHVYKVQPTSTGFQFYVDGVLKTTLSGTFPTGTATHIVVSAFKGSPSAGIKADWVRFDDYTSGGTFVSKVFDATRVATWGTATFTGTLPAGTSILIETSTGNTATPDATWSSWQAVGSGGAIQSPAARYIRYRITLITTDPTVTPILQDITITWS